MGLHTTNAQTDIGHKGQAVPTPTSEKERARHKARKEKDKVQLFGELLKILAEFS